MSPTIVLITGTTRGIGLGLLKEYLAKPNHTVIAANRHGPNAPASKPLHDLSKATGTNLILVKIDAGAREDAAAAMGELNAVHGIDYLDIVIANAATATSWPTVRDLDTDVMQEHVVPNVYGYVWLFQAAVGFLEKSEKRPLWIYVGSEGAWLTNMLPHPNACYAPTKLVGHFLTKSIHQQEPWLTAYPIHPGWVLTDMGREGARQVGVEEGDITGGIFSPEESARGMVAVADVAKRETHGGRMWTWEGEEVPW